MALYHKRGVKPGFTFALKFFMFISDGLGGVKVLSLVFSGKSKQRERKKIKILMNFYTNIRACFLNAAYFFVKQ